jgi:GT2 family glycosyltransferase
MKLSIVIVNYNVKHFLRQCLDSVLDATQNIEAEIFVVDNSSQDQSVEMVQECFPQVHLIANKENVGFSRANNQAIDMAKGEYILLLNPDTLVQKDTFEKSIQFMDEHPDAGALGVKMINGEGEFLPESKRALPIPSVAFYKIFGLSKLFPKSKKFSSYHLTYLDDNEINEVEVLAGAYMLLRKTAIDKVGSLDNTFFMYGEDVDLSYRITQGGYKNYYYPETRIIHYKGESTKKGSLNYVIVFYKAMQIFVEKHFIGGAAKIYRHFLNFAIWLRAGLAILKRVVAQLMMPILDFIVIYSGMLLLAKYWEQAVLIAPYPPIYRYLFVPLYIVTWILCIALMKGYKKPFALHKINKGILLGTVAILLIYSLLPETARYSRAIIVLGAMWTTVAMNSLRYLLHKLKIKSFYFGDSSSRKIMILGGKEVHRVALLVQLNDTAPEKLLFSDLTAPFDQKKFIELLEDEKINELVFCTETVEIHTVIDLITQLKDHNITFKIAPKEPGVLISPQDVRTPIAEQEVEIDG